MELLELVLLLLGAVLASTVLDQVTPRVSLPLVQIALGAVIAVLWASPLDVQIEPELFLVLFIAPLLFDESRHADKRALWENKGSIVSLAVGLVLLSVLVVGFVLNWIEPTIPLAAAFALGAALGPTDAVAVASLSKEINLTKRQSALLSGEALINDASGVVSFQFAIAAATTGAFSLADAGLSFALSFFGGIALGLVLGFAAIVVLSVMRSRGVESTTAHVVFEVFMPFVVFLAAEHVGVSGILAVVAAGLMMTFLPRKQTSASSRLKIVSSSVWDVLVFTINGVVFVLLGMELTILVSPTWDHSGMSRTMLVACVALLTAIVVGVRYFWILGMEATGIDPETGKRGRRVTGSLAKEVLATTLAGPKGAVTLSIAFTIPYTIAADTAFPHRDDLIFLASGVIVCTLLLANFVVPLISPKKDAEETERDREAEVSILREVIAELAEEHDPQTDPAARAVIMGYEDRIGRLMQSDIPDDTLLSMRQTVADRQKDYLKRAAQTGEASKAACDAHGERIDRMVELHERHGRKKHARRRGGSRSIAFMNGMLRRMLGQHHAPQPSDMLDQYKLMVGAETCAIDYLAEKENSADEGTARAARYLLSEHRSTLRALEARSEDDAAPRPAPEEQAGEGKNPGRFARARQVRSRIEGIEAEALRRELEQIQHMREENRISRDRARELREEVYLLQFGLEAD